jgi:hypothetical protein
MRSLICARLARRKIGRLKRFGICDVAFDQVIRAALDLNKRIDKIDTGAVDGPRPTKPVNGR